MKIKDDVESFFHAQGITIVTIQPEFSTKSSSDNEKGSGSLKQCLIGCQSIECAPKTCCSTNDLDAILVGDGKKKRKSKKVTSDRKSNSMVSLNVSSLAKLRKFTGSTPDIIKKSVSESHVTQMCSSDDSTDSQKTSTNPSATPSMANNLNSIDELKEKEFHEQCDERSERRLPPAELQSQPSKIESNAEHEDSSLLSCTDAAATPTTPSSPSSQPSSAQEQP